MRGENARLKSENETEALQTKAHDVAEKETLIQRQGEQRAFFQQREAQKRGKLHQQYKVVSEDRREFENRVQPAPDERKKIFKQRRRNAAAQKRGPEPERQSC